MAWMRSKRTSDFQPMNDNEPSKSRDLSSGELEQLQRQREQRIVDAREFLAKATAEAKERGVPLHKMIPVH